RGARARGERRLVRRALADGGEEVEPDRRLDGGGLHVALDRVEDDGGIGFGGTAHGPSAPRGWLGIGPWPGRCPPARGPAMDATGRSNRPGYAPAMVRPSTRTVGESVPRLNSRSFAGVRLR